MSKVRTLALAGSLILAACATTAPVKPDRMAVQRKCAGEFPKDVERYRFCVEVTMEGDRDKDLISDASDKCPDKPEDVDGFEDADGCPEPDNDEDGIPDLLDKCPLDPEDKDGFKDEDGCPEPDNDEDGIPDLLDKCPLDPEDKDGFEDEDGCPEAGSSPRVTKMLEAAKTYFTHRPFGSSPHGFGVLNPSQMYLDGRFIDFREIAGGTDDNLFNHFTRYTLARSRVDWRRVHEAVTVAMPIRLNNLQIFKGTDVSFDENGVTEIKLRLFLDENGAIIGFAFQNRTMFKAWVRDLRPAKTDE